MRNSLFFGILAFAFFSCIGKAEEKQDRRGSQGPYDLSKPDKVYALSKELKEISGIVYIPEELIACVQDEDGKIYIYNLKNSQIESIVEFDHKGDFEDIAKVENDFFLLRSDGTLFHKSPEQTVSYNTPMSHKDDTESLCYDKEMDCLIVGSKKGNKSFYAFDLKTHILKKDPLFSISEKKFSPTAMALHPHTKEFYILSKEKILVTSKEGIIKERFKLSSSLFSQPEGISFKEDGTLFISNEALDSEATILEFNYHPNGN
jgi:WD40 repeat protein